MNQDEDFQALKKQLPLLKVVFLAPRATFMEIFDGAIVRMTLLFLVIVSTVLATKIAQVGWKQTWLFIQENILIIVLLGIVIIFSLIRELYFSLNIVRLRLALKILDTEQKNEQSQ